MAKNKSSSTFISAGPAFGLSVADRIREATKSHLSRKISEWLLTNRATAADLARRAGLSNDHISRYHLKKSLPDETSLRRLAKAMSCDVLDLKPDRVELVLDRMTMPSRWLSTVPAVHGCASIDRLAPILPPRSSLWCRAKKSADATYGRRSGQADALEPCEDPAASTVRPASVLPRPATDDRL